MQTHSLIAHPAHPPLEVSAIEARITGRDENWLRVRWRIEGAGSLVIPAFAGKGRADGLWQTTCFELFLQPAGGAVYCEFNLSPSERWAAYDFERRREGMRERPVSREPTCTMRRGSTFAIFDAAIPADGIPLADCAMGLTAVIEESGGVKSYWALAHRGEAPDFHDPACFTAALAAPGPA
ncbi:DOMON-like domain-containing protein [Tsuneonella sp. HG222]